MELFSSLMTDIGILSAIIVGSTLVAPLLNHVDGTHHNRLASPGELAQYMGDDGMLLSQHVRLNKKYSQEHVAVFGPTGSGKSNYIVKHNVQQITSASIICTDPSGDIQRDIQRKDCKIVTFSPLDVMRSIGYDPLALCKDEYAVRSIMETLLLNGLSVSGVRSSDSEKWVKLSSPLVKMYAIYNFRYHKYTFTEMIKRILTANLRMQCTVTEMIEKEEPVVAFNSTQTLTEGETRKVKRLERVRKIDIHSIEYEILNTRDKELIDEFYAYIKTIDNSETYANIQLTLNSALAIFKDKNVKRICEKPAFNFKRLRYEKCIFFIEIPETLSEYFAPVTSILLQQLTEIFCETSEGLPIYFILDEMCNIGIIPNFDRILSTVRRYNIGILGCTQSISQLESLYGESKSHVILENFNTLCALSGLNETGEYFSSILGTMDVLEDSDYVRTKSVMTKDEIRRIDENKILIICKNKRGVIDSLLPLFKQ